MDNPEEHVHESAAGQLQGFTAFVDTKLADYKEVCLFGDWPKEGQTQVLNQNSAAVFAVNYVQNRFISTEFSVQIAKLWEVMGVHTAAEFEKALEAMKNDPDSCEPWSRERGILCLGAIVNTFEAEVKNYNNLLEHIDQELDEKIGPCTAIDGICLETL